MGDRRNLSTGRLDIRQVGLHGQTAPVARTFVSAN